jgi:FkbM family methyltransferase
MPLIDRLGINVILDVGANEGLFGKRLRMCGYNGWIVSFEPVRRTYDALVRAAAGDPKWRTFCCALGSAPGTFEINVMEGSEFCSFLTPLGEQGPRHEHSQNNVTHRESVPVKRLDDVLDECLQGIEEPSIFLKIDTQGFDLEVARGATATLDRIKLVQAEVSFNPIYAGMPAYSEFIDAFRKLGFGVVDFLPVSREPAGECAIEMDCILAPVHPAGLPSRS